MVSSWFGKAKIYTANHTQLQKLHSCKSNDIEALNFINDTNWKRQNFYLNRFEDGKKDNLCNRYVIFSYKIES